MARLRAVLCALGVCALCWLGSPSTAFAADGLLAPPSSCPDPVSSAPASAQIRAMLCYHAYARRRLGLTTLSRSSALNRSAGLKSRWIVTCRTFSHTACRRPFTSVFGDADYLTGNWFVGENLAWGSSSSGTVRSTFDRWLNSPPHRQDIIRPEWHDIGMAFMHVFRLFGSTDVTVWVVHFGRH
jgi:uncharacterized protein YkwD